MKYKFIGILHAKMSIVILMYYIKLSKPSYATLSYRAKSKIFRLTTSKGFMKILLYIST